MEEVRSGRITLRNKVFLRKIGPYSCLCPEKVYDKVGNSMSLHVSFVTCLPSGGGNNERMAVDIRGSVVNAQMSH